jgi:hypothetical protein
MFKNFFVTKNKISISISVFLLVLISGIVYYKALNYKTVMVEDLLFSSKYYNEQFQDKNIIKKIFTTSVYFDKVKYLYRPIFIFSFYIDSKISSGKVNVKVNHITSLLLHLFCILIFFYFLVDYCNFKMYLALIGSVLFSINIFSAWSTVWLSGRCDLLLFLFVFLSFIFFIKANENKNIIISNIFIIIHFLLFFLALLSKETAVVLPIVCLVFLYVKRYKLRLSYLTYVFIYILYYLMYSNDVNLIRQFILLFDVKNILYIICDYISAPFCLSMHKVISAYNDLTIYRGMCLIIFFIIIIMNLKEKKTILFYIFFAIAFFLPTLLGTRYTFQGNRMYVPFAFIIISILYIIEEVCKKDMNNIKIKLCTIALLFCMSINIIYIKTYINFAYDDNSIISLIYDEYKRDVKNKYDIEKTLLFLIRHYNMYGYEDQANNIKKVFFKQKNIHKNSIDN